MRIRNLLILILLSGCSAKPETITPMIKPLLEAVYASGHVVSDQEYQVFSLADGTLKEIIAKEGELVKKGQPLLVIESTQQNARYTMAKGAYDQALANKAPALDELNAQVERSRSKMEFDSVNLARFEMLIKSNATTQMEYDRARTHFKDSKNDYLAVRSRYKKTQNELNLAIQNAHNQLKIAEEESGNYMLRSEIDGMVFKISKERGELVRRSEGVAIVGKPDNFYLKLSVDELDVQRVQVGQEVVVRIDAYPQQTFNGKVRKVYPLIDVRQQSLRVDVGLDEALPGLFSGLAVEANIIIRKKDNALVIPRQYLLPGDSVFIETESGSKKIKVVRGIETMEEIEIVEGLKTDTRLIVAK